MSCVNWLPEAWSGRGWWAPLGFRAPGFRAPRFREGSVDVMWIDRSDRSELGFGFEAAGHQLLAGPARVLAFVHHLHHLLGDRHLDPAGGGDARHRDRAAGAFRDEMGAAGGLRQGLARRQEDAGAAGARATAPELRMPPETKWVPPVISARVLPAARSRPVRRLRDRLPVQVTTRSPRHARPAKVRGWPP